MDNSLRASAGFTMIEVLVSILIMTLGLLGLAGLQARAQQAELESYQRAQALVLVQDMVDRINANRNAALCYAITPLPDNGSAFVGTNATAPTCAVTAGTAATRAQADYDVAQWDGLLKGSAEALSGNQVGAMIGARGCVSLKTSVTPNVYVVSVAWQGMSETVDPTTVNPDFTCAKGTGNYDTNLKRRVVSFSFPMACLTC